MCLNGAGASGTLKTVLSIPEGIISVQLGKDFCMLLLFGGWKVLKTLGKCRHAIIRANIMNSICWTLSNHQALCQALYTHYLSILTKSHKVISVWLEGKGSNWSDKLLEVTWLVYGRCWLYTQDGPAPSQYSFLSGTLLPLEWKQGDGTCTWGNDSVLGTLHRLSSSNPNNYTDLARLVFFLFCSGSKNFT